MARLLYRKSAGHRHQNQHRTSAWFKNRCQVGAASLFLCWLLAGRFVVSAFVCDSALPPGNNAGSLTLDSGLCYPLYPGIRIAANSSATWQTSSINTPATLDLASQVHILAVTQGAKLMLHNLNLQGALLPNQDLISAGLVGPAPLAFLVGDSSQLILDGCLVTAASCQQLDAYLTWAAESKALFNLTNKAGHTEAHFPSFQSSTLQLSNTTFTCASPSPSTPQGYASTAPQLHLLITILTQLRLGSIVTITTDIALRDAAPGVPGGGWPLLVPASNDSSSTIGSSGAAAVTLTLQGPPFPAPRPILDFQDVHAFLQLGSGATALVHNLVLMNMCAALFSLDLMRLPGVKLVHAFNVNPMQFSRTSRSLEMVNITSVTADQAPVSTCFAISNAGLVGRAFPKYALFGQLMLNRIQPGTSLDTYPPPLFIQQANSTMLTWSYLQGVSILAIGSGMATSVAPGYPASIAAAAAAAVTSSNASSTPASSGRGVSFVPQPVSYCNPADSAQEVSTKAGAPGTQIVSSQPELESALQQLAAVGSSPGAVYYAENVLPFIVVLTKDMSLLQPMPMSPARPPPPGPGLYNISTNNTGTAPTAAAPQHQDPLLMSFGSISLLLMGTIYAELLGGSPPAQSPNLDLASCRGCLRLGPTGHVYAMGLRLKGLAPGACSAGPAPQQQQQILDPVADPLDAALDPSAYQCCSHSLPLWAVAFSQAARTGAGTAGGNDTLGSSGSSSTPHDGPQVQLYNVTLELPDGEFRALREWLAAAAASASAPETWRGMSMQVSSQSPTHIQLDSLEGCGINGTLITLLPSDPACCGATAPPQPPATPQESGGGGSSRLSAGALAGIVVGSVAGAALLAGLLGFLAWSSLASRRAGQGANTPSTKANPNQPTPKPKGSSNCAPHGGPLGPPQLQPLSDGDGDSVAILMPPGDCAPTRALGYQTMVWSPEAKRQLLLEQRPGLAAPAACDAAPPSPSATPAAAHHGRVHRHSSAMGYQPVVEEPCIPPGDRPASASAGDGGLRKAAHGASPPSPYLGSQASASTHDASAAAANDPYLEVRQMVAHLASSELQGQGQQGGSCHSPHPAKPPVAKLELQEAIGRGGQGTVYRGTWCNMDVAVKTIPLPLPAPVPSTPGCFKEPSSHKGGAVDLRRQQVLREAAVCCSLDHPNVVMTYHYEIARDVPRVVAQPGGMLIQHTQGAQEHKLYLIQELCDCSLSQASEQGLFHEPGLKGALRVWALLPVLCDVAEGMCYLHSRNIVHGDIKPSNAMLKVSAAPSDDSASVVCKLGDFGLCHTMDPQQTHVSDCAKGTPYYAAPEVFQRRQVTKLSDVYSFGVLAWSLAWGRHPFTLDRLCRDAPHPNLLEASMPPGTPPGLQALVAECLRTEPPRRPDFAAVRLRLLRLAADLDLVVREKQQREQGQAEAGMGAGSEADAGGRGGGDGGMGPAAATGDELGGAAGSGDSPAAAAAAAGQGLAAEVRRVAAAAAATTALLGGVATGDVVDSFDVGWGQGNGNRKAMDGRSRMRHFMLSSGMLRNSDCMGRRRFQDPCSGIMTEGLCEEEACQQER